MIAGGIGIRYQRITTLERGREGVPLSGGKALVYSVMLLCLGAIMVVLEILRALGSFG
ncbi:unnamed protein product [marine sediment metagenome]|uniref:Uncharacterized protein n=1 Tax=marine sediment metagenome TaxID=412755 RepID=X1N0W3_9ZZZZ